VHGGDDAVRLRGGDDPVIERQRLGAFAVELGGETMIESRFSMA
jgi:hypothetical protein